MKMDQNTTQTSTAFLRNATGVDMTETNSLCCAAAGIIAPLSATAEALIPHDKLRGAAHLGATLNAQARPSAQPVVGYTHARSMKQALNFPQAATSAELQNITTRYLAALSREAELRSHLAAEVQDSGVGMVEGAKDE